ncbi:MAG: chitooligosaccharide deacetylase [Blastopirellula sp.]|nr:MAG: chitooligosaccharide deacetylase [Blastopirellula sp.]
MSSIRKFVKYALGTFVPNKYFLVNTRCRTKILMLTFDDGPLPESTPMILDALDHYNAKATFFVLGKNAKKHPELILEIVKRGHDLGNHTYSHPRREEILREEWTNELRATDEILKSILGATTQLYRPPRGKLKLFDFIELWRNGITSVLWNRDPEDFKSTTEDIKRWFVKNQLCSGDIILLHDTSAATVLALPSILKLLKDRQFEFISCSKALKRSWKSKMTFSNHSSS